MSEIRHIVFDLGNVLIRWEPERPYRWLMPDEQRRRRFLTEICNSAWISSADGGLPWSEAEAGLIARFPEEEEMIRAFRKNWHEMTPYSLGETVVILEELIAAAHDVTALSNIAADTYQECIPRFPFLRLFRGTTVSGQVKLVKPDLAIYERHVSEFGLDPSATLFFDDSPGNIDAAHRSGWNAELFTDADTMRADLRRYGIAIPEKR